MKTKHKIVVVLTILVIVLALSACRRSGISNGRFEAVDENIATMVMQAIIIDGNNLTMVYPPITGGIGITTRFSYNRNTGVITITDGAAGLSAMEYRDGSIWFGEAEFTRVNR